MKTDVFENMSFRERIKSISELAVYYKTKDIENITSKEIKNCINDGMDIIKMLVEVTRGQDTCYFIRLLNELSRELLDDLIIYDRYIEDIVLLDDRAIIDLVTEYDLERLACIFHIADIEVIEKIERNLDASNLQRFKKMIQECRKRNNNNNREEQIAFMRYTYSYFFGFHWLDNLFTLSDSPEEVEWIYTGFPEEEFNNMVKELSRIYSSYPALAYYIVFVIGTVLHQHVQAEGRSSIKKYLKNPGLDMMNLKKYLLLYCEGDPEKVFPAIDEDCLKEGEKLSKFRDLLDWLFDTLIYKTGWIPMRDFSLQFKDKMSLL